ncbi:MAG TPA: hypothetical protein VLT45_16805 [Kofleriaceae bacterium]|nr:hypothetical protein [Kofleriaceae bacterium]
MDPRISTRLLGIRAALERIYLERGSEDEHGAIAYDALAIFDDIESSAWGNDQRFADVDRAERM